jgi:hypothetical protein
MQNTLLRLLVSGFVESRYLNRVLRSSCTLTWVTLAKTIVLPNDVGFDQAVAAMIQGACGILATLSFIHVRPDAIFQD